MNKQQLSAKIWASANGMRSKIDASEYKDYILGFIFYKYLSEREEQWLKSRGYDAGSIEKYVNEDAPDNYSGKSLMQQNLGYFIAYKDLFSTWIKMGPDFSVGNVRTALSAFSRLISPSHQKVYTNIFNTLETGLSKLGESTKSQTTAVSGLIHLIDTIPMDGKQDYDLLGYIYEDLIGKFASSAGKKAGEFYTPHEVSLLMAYIIADHLKGREEIKIYDPTSGSASLLLNIGRACAHYLDDQNKIRYYAQELNANTYNLTRMNLVMRGILPDNIVTRNADTLEEDWPYFDEADPKATYEPLYVDAVVSNPPYSQAWEPKNKENDPRFAGYGLAPKSKADYAFLLHDLFHLKPDGIMAIVLPHGVLFRGGEEGEIRRNLIERNNIDAIIGLPANIFFGTGIPTIIMVLRQKRENTDVLIVDAAKGFEKEGKNNKLRACDIRKIVDTVTQRLEVANYSRRVSLEEIRQNDYNLNIPRYVDSSEKAESWDIYASMFGGIPGKELDDFDLYWVAFPSLKGELFNGNGSYLSLHTDDVVGAIHRNKDVQAFENKFKAAFADYDSYLEHALIDQAETVSIPRTEDLLRDDLFRRFEGFLLLDPYQAFEIFSKEYEVISGDLELIQAEGMQAVRGVDPNMVTKKKDGTDGEVQDGWKGHIIPFDIFQKVYLKDELNSIDQKNNRLQEITDRYSQLSEDLSEDDKSQLGDAVDEDGAFVFKNIKARIKELKKTDAGSPLTKTLEEVSDLNTEEKNLKKKLKGEQEELQILTKQRIENLTDEEARNLLHVKWIVPITSGIDKLSDDLIDDFAKKIKALSTKYSTTFKDIEYQIKETEHTLCQMMDDLTGSDTDMSGIRELQKLLEGDSHD